MTVAMTRTKTNGIVTSAKMHTTTWGNAQEAFAIMAEEEKVKNAFQKRYGIVLSKTGETVDGKSRVVHYNAIQEAEFKAMIAGFSSLSYEQVKAIAE